MNTATVSSILQQNKTTELSARSDEIFQSHLEKNYAQTDRLFGYLFIFQWILGIIFAVVISPLTWIGKTPSLHLHMWAAVFLGALIIAYPLYLIATQPGKAATRHTIAVAQALTSVLLIHLSGGRIEAHFHIFGSLAFLACYRDWKVLVTMSAIVAIDHMVRGIFWPQSVYGVLTESPWRWVEHAAWVVFEDAFLIRMCLQNIAEMKLISSKQAELELINREFEDLVARQTADLQKANVELKRSNENLENFATVASHDLQEPLRKILAFSTQLMEENAQDLDEDALSALQRMHSASERMRALINSLLTYSRVIRKGEPFKTTNLNDIAADAYSDLELKIKEKNATVHIESLPEINCDATQLHQVLLNLINNALKFQKKDPGNIPVVRVFSRPDQNTDFFQLIVEDNGIGIDPKYQQRIFGIFQRLHSKQEYEGTGIGLAVCQKIAERHGGSIAVESTPGQGSRFIITLPRHQSDTEELPQSA